MNYQKNTWSYGDLITEAKMNNIEEGISNVVEAVNSIPKNSIQSINGNLPDKDGNIQISLGGDADALLAAHNSDATAHEDIRSSIENVDTKLNNYSTVIDNSIMIDKSFGNGPDTIAEGDHIHGDLQLQIQSIEEVINADYYDNSNSANFFTEITPSHTLWSATSSSKVTDVDIIGGRYTCTTSVAEQGLKTSNLTDFVDVVKGKTIVGVANLSSDNYTLYIKMHNGTSWSFGKIKSTDKIVTVKVPDNLTQFKFGLEYGGDGSAPDTCVMTNFALYLVNDVTITSTENIPNRNYTIWSWDDEEIRNPKEFASFCNAYKINRVYQHVSTSVLDLETIRKFVGTMQKNRISVNWLTGDPLWALTEHHYHIAEQIQKVVSYNMSIQNDYEKIGTIQFDIEPHALDEWNADQASVIKQYQDAVVLMYKESLAKQLSLNVCVPSWFDSVAYDNEYGQGNLFDFVSKHSSSTVIMAYNTKSYVSIAEDEIRIGALNGKNVAVGLETHEITESITEDISFANKPIEDLYRAFETLFLVYKIYGVYKGYEFVIHDYGYFKAYTDKFNLIIPPNNILDKLTTDNKTDLISAINEINTEVEQLKESSTGTTKKDTIIEWNTFTTPTVTFDMSVLGLTAHKISNSTPTKEQLLSAKWQLSSPTDNEIYNPVLTKNNILLENNNIIAFQLYTSINLGYLVCYNSGVITVSYNGAYISINIPETGIYQLWDFGYNLPNTMFGSMAYTKIEKVDFVQSDWNQSNSTRPDYIKNKPFYIDKTVGKELLPAEERTFRYSIDNYIFGDFGASQTQSFIPSDINPNIYVLDHECGEYVLKENTVWRIRFNGYENAFDCCTFIVTTSDDENYIAIGNTAYCLDTIINNCPENTEMPFFIRNTPTGIKVTTGIQQDIIEIYMVERDENPGLDFSTLIESLEPLVDNKIQVNVGNENFESTVYKASSDLLTLYYSGNISILSRIALGIIELEFGSSLISDDTKPFIILNIVNKEDSSITSALCYCKTDDLSLEPKIFFGFSEDKQEIVKLDPIYLPDDIKLPTITSDTDEGKFLRVISGVATWSTIPNAEEASF